MKCIIIFHFQFDWFSFVPLVKCDLTLVDVRPLDQSIPTHIPQLNPVRSFDIILSTLTRYLDYINSSSNTSLRSSWSDVIHSNVTNSFKTTSFSFNNSHWHSYESKFVDEIEITDSFPFSIGRCSFTFEFKLWCWYCSSSWSSW